MMGERTGKGKIIMKKKKIRGKLHKEKRNKTGHRVSKSGDMGPRNAERSSSCPFKERDDGKKKRNRKKNLRRKMREG